MGYIDRIESLGAREDFVAWLRDNQHQTIADAWAACPRGDWMAWMLDEFGSDTQCEAAEVAYLACARSFYAAWNCHVEHVPPSIGDLERVSAPVLADYREALRAIGPVAMEAE